MHQSSEQPASKRTLNIIWIAFMAATVFYIGLGIYMARGMSPKDASPIIAVAFGMAAMALVIAGFRLPARKLAVCAVEGESVEDILPLYQTAMIIRWAAFESVAVLGLVLLVVTGSLSPLLVGSGFALVLIATAKPDPEGLLRRRV